MRLSLGSYAVLLVALPALADNALLTQPVVAELTTIDAAPAVLSTASFGSTAVAQASLEAIALDPSVDLGIRIRALRSLAAYCQTSCDTAGVHQTLGQIISTYQTQNQDNPTPSGRDLVLLRAALETMGASHLVLPADIPGLLPLLEHPSRDVRATAVRSLRTTCDGSVLRAIVALQPSEPTAQVRTELTTAEQMLDACVPK